MIPLCEASGYPSFLPDGQDLEPEHGVKGTAIQFQGYRGSWNLGKVSVRKKTTEKVSPHMDNSLSHVLGGLLSWDRGA